MRKLLVVSILAVLPMATYGMSPQASKSPKDIQVRYDKFKDVTTVTTMMGVGTVRHLSIFTVAAMREGQSTASTPRFYLSFSDIDDSDAKLILLIDGVRSTLTPASGTAIFPTDIEQLAKIGAANSVEGQVGSVEFALTPAQRAQMKRFVEYFHDK